MMARFDTVKVTRTTVFISDRNEPHTASITADVAEVAEWSHRYFPGLRLIYEDRYYDWDEILIDRNGRCAGILRRAQGRKNA